MHCLFWREKIDLSKYEKFEESSPQPLEMVANPHDIIHISFTTPDGHQYFIGSSDEKGEEVFSTNYFGWSNCKVFVFRIDPSPDKIIHKYVDVNYWVRINSQRKQKIQLRIKNMERHGECSSDS